MAGGSDDSSDVDSDLDSPRKQGHETLVAAQGLPPSGHSIATTPSRDPANPENLVSIFCENNPNYRLARRADGVVLAFKNLEDPKQHWIKVDMGDKFMDQEGHPGFILVNKASGEAICHLGGNVTPMSYDSNAVEGSILWSRGREEGKGYTAIRPLTNTQLNLDADHGSEKHGGVKDGNRLLLFKWNKQENQKWKIVPLGSGE